jgi:hypothetical protein
MGVVPSGSGAEVCVREIRSEKRERREGGDWVLRLARACGRHRAAESGAEEASEVARSAVTGLEASLEGRGRRRLRGRETEVTTAAPAK